MDKSMEKSPTNSSEEQSRRSACDRCRGQKLRCERKPGTENGSNACKRCIKARVRCVSSPQRRLGRPRQQSLPQQSQSRATTPPMVLDFDAFLDSREVGINQTDDFLEMCSPRTKMPKINHEPIPKANNSISLTDGPTISPFDSEYMILDPPIFHNEPASYASSETDPVSIPGYLKDECLEKLSTLNSSLFRQLSSIASGKLADCRAFSPSSTNSSMDAGDPFSGQTPFGSPGSLIGNMLQSSQEFLDILKCFLPSPSNSSSHSPSHSSLGSSFSDFDSDDLFSNELKFDYNSPSYSLDRRASSSASSLLSSNQPSNSLGALSSDIPSTLAILTCYVCLVRIYRTIFAQIHQSLVTQSPLTDLPTVLPGLQLGGFQLDGNQNLQIKVLVEVSMHMLDQIETTLGLPDEAGSGGNGGGLLEDSVSATLLNIVINQEAVESPEGDRAGVKSLRTTVKSIHGLLKGF